jgi:creatinine amidohydrolase
MKTYQAIQIFIVSLLFTAVLVSQTNGPTEKKLSDGGHSIFDETMVDSTYQEVEEAASQHAIVLWPLGVIEEHGPHLPLGTDIYNSYLEMKQVARLLRAKGKKIIIAPPLYWGINEVTASFGGSFSVRPSTLKSLIEDTFFSLRKDGFQTVYLITGHGDRLHNQTIVEAVAAARSITGLRGFVIIDNRMRDRLSLTGKEPYVLVLEEPTANPSLAARELDIHAGASETSLVWAFFPQLVKVDLLPSLKPTKYGPEHLAEWRKGWDNARQITPLGYFGDPASADPNRGKQIFSDHAARLAEAIARHIESSPWNQQNR